MKPILEVKHIWKAYTIGRQQERYLSFRDALVQRLRFQKSRQETFWALKDISFDVQEGDCIGIIGRNGAGKSTLLKVLSKITPPTKGQIIARGRIASLLEVGTGFHPELTGRENIYFNGSILGLTRSEINRKFDEIVDFSGVEKFLDTPLKHYSSGMQLRLAFSVAAHLEPEILLIDEVLAVGDVEFQKKCLGKMDEVSKSGRTVLFVSHNLGAVRQLCKKSILFKQGILVKEGPTEEVLTTYLNSPSAPTNTGLEQRIDRRGNGTIRIKAINLLDANLAPIPSDTILSGETIFFKIDYQTTTSEKINNFEIGLSIFNRQNQFITVLNNRMSNYPLQNLPVQGTLLCSITNNPFMYGTYSLDATVMANGQLCDRIQNAFQFFVTEGDFYRSGYPNTHERSGIYIQQEWSIEPNFKESNLTDSIIYQKQQNQ